MQGHQPDSQWCVGCVGGGGIQCAGHCQQGSWREAGCEREEGSGRRRGLGVWGLLGEEVVDQ